MTNRNVTLLTMAVTWSVLSFNAFAEDLPTVVAPQRAVVGERAPIAFVPYELKDAQGRSVPPDAIVEIPASGTSPARRVRAGEYLKTLNDAEKFLTQHGYSLRRPQEIPPELYESGIDPRQVAAQAAHIDEVTVVFDSSFMHQSPSGDQLQREHDAARAAAEKPSMEGLLKLSRYAPTENVEALRQTAASYNNGCTRVNANEGCLRREAPGFDYGRRDLAWIAQQTYMEMRGHETRTHAIAETGLEAGMINTPFKILHILARLDGSDREGDKIHIEATKLGRRVFSFDSRSRDGIFDDLPSGLGLTRDAQRNTYPFLQENWPIFQASVVIVIVPVTVRVGARTVGEFKWHTPSSFTHLGLQFGPRFNAGAYAQAALGIGVEAGVDGEVTLIEDELNVGGHVKFRMSATRGPFFEALATATNTLEALRGTISVYARFPCGIDADLWPPSIDLKWCEPKVPLVGWDPITLSRLALFNERYVWWLGKDGVAGGATSDDTVAGAMADEEDVAEEERRRLWEALEKEEDTFFAWLDEFLSTWSPERIRSRADVMSAKIDTAIGETRSLGERLRGDLER